MEKETANQSMLGSTLASYNEETTFSDISKSYKELLFVQNYSTVLFNKKRETSAKEKVLSKKEILITAHKENLEDVEELFLNNLGIVDVDLEEGVLEGLENIKVLNLSHNSMLDTSSLFPFFSLIKLDLSFNSITSLNHMDCLVNLEELVLNNNMVESFLSLSQCSKLRVILAQRNHLCQLFELIRVLKPLNELEQLAIEGNPFKLSHPAYREFLITMLPQLKCLDDQSVNDIERDIAIQVIQNDKSKGILDLENEANSDSLGFASRLRGLTRHCSEARINTQSPEPLKVSAEVKHLNLQIAQLRDQLICKDLENQQLKEELRRLQAFEDASALNMSTFTKIERCVSAKEKSVCSSLTCRQMTKGLQRHLDNALEKLLRKEKNKKFDVSLEEEEEDVELIVQKSLNKISEVRHLIKAMNGEKEEKKPSEQATWKLKTTKVRSKVFSQKDLGK